MNEKISKYRFTAKNWQFCFDRIYVPLPGISFFDKRIDFQVPESVSFRKSGSWFAPAWFTNWMNLGKSFQFYRLKGG